jgi:DNA ligase-1
VKIFSRNCEDRTEAFPDVVSAFLDAARGGTGFTGGGGLAIDAEIVGIDRETGKLLPFQDLSRRPRKDAAFDAAAGGDRKNIVHTCVFVFDILLSGDEDALGPGGARTHDLTLRSRRARLDAALPGVASGSFAGKFEYARSIEIRPLASGEGVDDPAERAIASVRAFTLEALSAACEGVVLKRLDGGSSYVPGERRDGWIKLKKDYEASLRDSLDLVPIGAWRGNGRKAKWFSPFLLATYDAETGTYQSLCRCMSGFTDAFYAEKTAFYGGFLDDAPGPADEAAEDPKTARGTKKKPRNYDTLETPDVWFDPPREVWEIRGADLTVSPKHRACAGRRHETRGLGLRFPRFIRAREDKSPGDLDAVAGGGPSGPEDVLALFDAQVRRFQGQEREAGKRKRAMTALEEAGAGEEDDEDEDEDEEEEEEEDEEEKEEEEDEEEEEEEEEEENGARGAR